jgi:hypothetical protein
VVFYSFLHQGLLVSSFSCLLIGCCYVRSAIHKLILAWAQFLSEFWLNIIILIPKEEKKKPCFISWKAFFFPFFFFINPLHFRNDF